MNNISRLLSIISFCLLACAQAASAADRKTVADIVYICAGGQRVTISGETSAKITDEYVNGASQGTNYVYENMGAIFAGVPADKIAEVTKIYTDCINNNLGRYHPAYNEPTQQEMRATLDDFLTNQLRKEGNVYTIENPLNGYRVEMLEFRKQDCRVAVSGSGYDCSYSIRMRQSLFSKESSQAAQEQAKAWNSIMGMIGAQTTPREVVVKRFVKTEQGWTISPTQ